MEKKTRSRRYWYEESALRHAQGECAVGRNWNDAPKTCACGACKAARADGWRASGTVADEVTLVRCPTDDSTRGVRFAVAVRS